MTANAPYFQIRDHDYDDSLNAHPYEPAQDEEYALSSSIAPSASMYNENTQSHNALNRYDGQLEQTHNLVELLEAATTAAGQVGSDREANNNGPQCNETLRNSSHMPATSRQKKRKRKRTSSPIHEEMEGEHAAQRVGDSAPSNKRMRVSVPHPAKDPRARGPDEQAEKASVGEFNVLSPDPDHLSDARAAGVHSAAALFRKPSTQMTKKYTRPPMSKLFISLQLTPENFLHLQAQAKAYMLDSTHPERQNCVGNRGKGDTDMVKLRLFNCVRDFLVDGAGERFFGESVEKPGERDSIEAAKALGEENVAVEGRRWVWPRDGNKIISLVTPLLRRMVTNERQRVYAIETRRGGRRKEGSVDSAQVQDNELGMGIEGNGSPFDPSLPPTFSRANQSRQPSASPSLSTSHLSPLHQHLQPVYMAPEKGPPDTNLLRIAQKGLPSPQHLFSTVHISLVKNRAKLVPSSHLNVDMTTSLDDLMQEVLSLVRMATITYPELTPSKKAGGMEPETLRGLAVAATAAGLDTDISTEQTNTPTIVVEGEEHSVPDDTGHHSAALSKAAYMNTSTSSVSPFPPHSALPDSDQEEDQEEENGPTNERFQCKSDEILPRFKIKALGSQGLQVIETTEDWEYAKSDCRDSAWAEGVLKVVVDFDSLASK